MKTPREITIPSLPSGQTGTVVRVLGNNGQAKRLADIGFVRGALVEMIRSGSPCIVRVDGLCIGLGDAHQRSIELRTE